MTTPNCSIVIPTFNCRDYLPIALNSVRLQNVGPIEILVLDDGSSDGSWDFLQSASAENPELRVFKGDGIGPSDARNYLISLAKSEFIAFLDADDYWWPNKLKSQLSFHQKNPDVVFSFSDYLHVDINGDTHGTAFEFWRPQRLPLLRPSYSRIERPIELLLGCNLVGTSTVIARTDALQNAKGFAKDMPSAEDWDLWLRLAECGAVACSSVVTMSYLQRPGSLTSNREARLEAMGKIIARYEPAADATMKKALRQGWSRYYAAHAEHHRANMDGLRAAFYHLAACAHFPTARTGRAFAADIKALILGQRSSASEL